MNNNGDRTKVAVIGCGTIGASWAEGFLSRGMEVRAWDPQPGYEARLAAAAERHGDALVFCGTAAEAVEGTSVVQESGPEDLELKHALYRSFADAVSQGCVVASSTSTLPATQLQKSIPFADRILVGHPFNPPHILPLVEVVGGLQTAETTVTRAMEFYRRAGKHPIRLNRERPGHLANRLQAAIWREAVDAVACGQASVEDVDAAVTLALGPRWALMGPFATFNLGGGEGGLAHFLDHLGEAFEGLWDDAHRPEVTEELRALLVEGAAKGQGGRSIRELVASRDRKLAAILAIAKTE